MVAGLLAEELSPVRPGAPGRRRKPGGNKEAPDRAGRDTQAELEQLAGDPRVAPARVLAREAQHELAHTPIDGRTAPTSLRLRPFATHKLPMPAQERLRRHDQSVATARRKQSSERRKQSTIGWPQRRPPFSPVEHGQLMSQHK